MSPPLTRVQFAQGVLDCLDKATEDVPEDKRAEVQAAILNAFGARMFMGPIETQEEKK